MRKKIIAGLILLVLFLGISMLVSSRNSGIHEIDTVVNNAGLASQTSTLTYLMSHITRLGDGGDLTIIVIVALVIFMLLAEWRMAACLGFGFLFVNLLTSYLKNFYLIARPNMPLASNIGNWSYPSGHTTGVTIVFLILALGLSRIVKNRPMKVLCVTICGSF